MRHRECVKVLLCVSMFAWAVSGRARAAAPAGLDLQFSMKAQPVTVTVTGKVIDKGTRAPLADALVRGHIVIAQYRGPDYFERCPRAQTRTDAQGRYRLQFVTPLTTSGPMKGKDGLCVYAGIPGYEGKPIYPKALVTPDSTEYHDCDFELGPGQRIAGTVVDAEGRPVPDALVRLQDPDAGDLDFFGAWGQTNTNDQGHFQMWIRKGQRQQWLDILKPGRGALLLWEGLDKGEMGTLVLPRGGSIQGRIVDPAGKGVAGCEVSVRDWPCDLIDKVLTDSEGRYVLRGIPGDPSIMEFFRWKNGSYSDVVGKADVYARVTPDLPLLSAPTYRIRAQDGVTLTGPDLVVGGNASVSGKVTAAHHLYGLRGLLVRLDYDWGKMVETDADGNFQFPYVSPGKHRLVAYLPRALRYDHGIGGTEIEVAPGQPPANVSIELDLGEVRVQFLDADGNPLPGITAGATWSPDGSGDRTEGTKSDATGWAALYLYPGEEQYVRGFDSTGSLVAETCEKVHAQPGLILRPLHIVMVPSASLQGTLTDPNGAPVTSKAVLCTLAFADGVQVRRNVRTDDAGRFRLEALPPGIAKLSLKMGPVVSAEVTGPAFELKPGAVKDLGQVVLKNGYDREAVAREKLAHALDYAAEVHQAAEQLFEKIQTADYAHYLQKDVPWYSFPIVGYYTTDHWFDVLVPWICTTFSKNPIVKVELGTVFLNTVPVFGKPNLPTVPYKLTLQDGTRLEGNLPFEFTPDGPAPHWHGLGGIDWHLRNPR